MAMIEVEIKAVDLPINLYQEVANELFSMVELEVVNGSIHVNFGMFGNSIPDKRMSFGMVGATLMRNYTDRVQSWETGEEGKKRIESTLKGIIEFIRVAEELKKYVSKEDWL